MQRPALHAAAALLLACALPAHAAGEIAVTVTPDQPALGKGDDVNVTVTLTNTGNTPQRLLKWRTPFVPAEHALFQITRDGLPVRYLGRHVKRAAPTEADYIVLAPGETRSARVELSKLYEMQVTGAYSVRYYTSNPSNAAPSAKAGADIVVGDLASSPAAIWMVPKPSVVATPIAVATTAATLTTVPIHPRWCAPISGCSRSLINPRPLRLNWNQAIASPISA